MSDKHNYEHKLLAANERSWFFFLWELGMGEGSKFWGDPNVFLMCSYLVPISFSMC